MPKLESISDQQFDEASVVLHGLPFAKMIGMRLADLKPDEATIEIEMRDELRHPGGILHGGVTATLIDTAMAFAVRTRVERTTPTATIDLTVHYLRPHLEGKFICTAKIVKAGRRIFTVSADVYNEKGDQIATGLSTYTTIQ